MTLAFILLILPVLRIYYEKYKKPAQAG